MKDLRDWIDVIFKVAIAVVSVVVGYYFSFHKQQNEDVKLIVDLTTSAEAPRRLLGGTVANAYFKQKRIPEELYLAVIEFANTSADQHLAAIVNTGAAQTSKEKPGLRDALTKAADALPVRIYFHVREENDRDTARNLEKTVESWLTEDGNSIVVPGIELVRGKQMKSQLKCFRKSECEKLGKWLVQMFIQNGVPMELSDQSGRYERASSIRPNHFEAWFAPGVRPA